MRRRRHNYGFTLIELIVIMVMVGALAVFATGRFASQDVFEARGYHDELVSAARYAQRYAVASGCTVRISINATGYAITTQDAICGFGTNVQRPDGGNFSGNAPAGVSVTSGTGNYDFNALGDASAGGTVTVAGGGSIHSFAITAGSGFVNEAA